MFQTIVIDPPWQVKAGPASLHKPNQPSRDLVYPTMSLDAIRSLQIPKPDNCHIYLWTINHYLEHSFGIMREWGFNPSTTLVWAKDPMGRGLGGAYGICTEYLIFGRRGKLPAKERSFRNWWNLPRKGGHSVKPEFFYDLVEKVSPGPYLEIFARKPRLGWTSLGNEVTGNDIAVDLAKYR